VAACHRPRTPPYLYVVKFVLTNCWQTVYRVAQKVSQNQTSLNRI